MKTKKLLTAALEAATADGNEELVKTLSEILKGMPDDQPEGTEMPEGDIPEDSEPKQMMDSPEAPPELAVAVTAVYPDSSIEDFSSEGMFVVIKSGEEYLKIPFTLEGDVYTLGEPQKVEPEKPEPEPKLEVMSNRTKQIRAKDYLFELKGEPPTELKLWDYGVNQYTKGNFYLTRKNADAIVKARKARGVDLFFDYEHASYDENRKIGDPIPAAAWFNVEARNDGFYLTNIRWVAEAAEMIKAGEYRYISPVFDVDTNTNEITAIHNSALTNDPATIGISALIQAKADLRTAQKELEVMRLQAHNKKISETIQSLENAGVPTAVIALVRPIIAARDVPVIASEKSSVNVIDIVTNALLEFARVGKVPLGTVTPFQTNEVITLPNAVKQVRAKWEAEGRKNIRETDLYVEARKQFSHLRDTQGGSL